VIACKDAVQQLWDYLDGALPERDRVQVEQHLEVCRLCCGELDFAHELRAFLARHAAEELPDDVRDRLTSTLDELEGRA
jgi:mycothiol system anti-sigma-R factor